MHWGYWLLSAAMSIHALSTDHARFEPFKTQPGIYYDEIGRAHLSTSEWKFILYYNLTNYWQEWEDILVSTNQLEHWCDKNNWWFQTGTNTTGDRVRPCTNFLQPLHFLVKELEEHNQILRSSTTRSKRAPLEFVGTLLSDLFGVLDQRDATLYRQQIEGLTNGNIQLKQLVEKQTHVLDITGKLLKKGKDVIETQYHSIREDIATIQLHEELIDAVLQLTLAVTVFKDVQDALIDVIADIHHGRVSTQLISTHTLEEQLNQLQQLIPSSTRIPDYHHHWSQMYQLLTIKTGIVQHEVIFEVKLPLLQRDEFQVFNVIPVPTLVDHSFMYIRPTSAYILMNLQWSWYYPLTKDGLNMCKRWKERSVICNQDRPVYSMQGNNLPCEVALLNHATHPPAQCIIKSILPAIYVAQLQQSNKWIMVLENETVFDLLWKDTVQPITLNGSGVLTLRPGSTLRGRSLLITSHIAYTTEKNMSFLPNFNLAIHLQMHPKRITAANMETEFQELEQAIAQLTTENTWVNITSHDIYHYTASSIIIIILSVLVVIWVRRQVAQRAAMAGNSQAIASPLQLTDIPSEA